MSQVIRLRLSRKMVCLLAVIMLISSAAIVHAATVTITLSESGSLSATGPTIPNRIFRDAIPSTCGGKAYPGNFGGPNTYAVHGPYGPLATDSCITINYDEGTCGAAAHAAAYSGGFNPSDLSIGYLGDVGSSITQSFSFPVAAGESFVVVVVSNNVPLDCNYSFTSAPFSIIETVTTTDCVIRDGRINNKPGMDCGAPIIVYTPDDGEKTIDIYSANPANGEGYMDIRISLAAIEEAGIPANNPLLLVDESNHWNGRGLQLFRLPSGELQINTFYSDGKPYTIAWQLDAPDHLYHLAS
jgi:hypothetical protein